MRVKTILLILFIVSLMFLARSPAMTEEKRLDIKAATPIPIDAAAGYAADPQYYLSDTEYLDPTLHVTIETDSYLKTNIQIVRVQIAHPSQLRTAFANRYGTQTTVPAAKLAKRVNAVTAVNADFHSFDNHGVILRQGHLYRSRFTLPDDILIIDDKGDFHVVLRADQETFYQAYDALGGAFDEGGRIINVITFGPLLVNEGQLAHETYSRVNNPAYVRAQRVVIAQVDTLSYLLVVTEGPESKNSKGLTLMEMAEYMKELGCRIAYNLDGGSSASLIFRDKKINSLDTHKVRYVSDIIYFSTGLPGGE
ncbi:MAG: phosphodiester glycosidase family protein [Clostridia bacterium]|nr:phosphodiester glycosidase family protein [Clostridia bacterium]